MQILCGLQVVFFLFNCQTPVWKDCWEKSKKVLTKNKSIQYNVSV